MRKEYSCESVASMKSREMEEDEQVLCWKRRRFCSEVENERQEVVVENFVASPAASWTSGCSKDGESKDVVKSLRASTDLENLELKLDGYERENSTSMAGGFSRETTPTSELCGDSEEVLMNSVASTPTKKSPVPPSMSRRKSSSSSAEKMPSEAELEEFFTTAEKYEQKRFAEKYNYDIVKDVPLEGKYQWVRLH
ncbi:cyclin-dependent kinase inhibitor 7 [Andrographis paniculata]|uniref:cyclin-dependent kinase inhibitor 7 n=1 Tax=Andrographis paniculata TaxID=175694 RepID=UPI0021E881EC|nr:cyclin-dependent kinase inhibitor 7 [Andrographis paniculata]